MSTEKEAIAEVLRSLDQKDDTLWTDDGSPLVSEIQRLTNDKTITRAQINEALPGFARKSTESIEEPADDLDGETGGDPAVASTDTIIEAIIAAPPEPPADGEPLSEADEYERLRLIARSRVEQAEVGVAEAKTKIAEAQKGLVSAEARLTRALQLYSAKYPAISAAANIKQHLARQQELLHLRVTGKPFVVNSAQNPVDARLMDRKRDNGRNGPRPAPAPFLPRKAAVAY